MKSNTYYKSNMYSGYISKLLSLHGSKNSYIFAFALVALSVMVRLAFVPIEAGHQFLQFFPVIVIAALIGGLWTGLFATLISALSVIFILTPATVSPAENPISSVHGTIPIFVLFGFIVSLCIEAMHRFLWFSVMELQNAHAKTYQIVKLQHETETLFQRNQVLMQNSMDGIHIMDTQGQLIMANDAFCKMLGYTQEEILGLNISNWVVNIPTPEMLKRLKHAIGNNVRVETLNRCKNGDIIDVEISIAGRVIGGQELIYASSRDITERKNIELAKLQESDLRFRGTLEQAAVGIIHASLDGCYQQVNQKFCEIIGYSREELLKMNFREVTYFEDLAQEDELLLQLLGGRINNFSREQRYIRKDNTTVWINLTVSLLRKANAVPAYYIGVIENIAERKQAEMLTRQYEYLLENSFNEIYVIDARDLHFILTSVGAERNLGYSHEELNQLTPLDLRPGYDKKSFEKRMAPLLSGDQQSLAFESTHTRKDGSIYFVEVRLQYVAGDNPVFVAIAQDISERKQYETEINQSRKKLRELIAQREEMRENERKMIAREVHDELGQYLTALRMQLSLLRIECCSQDLELTHRVSSITELLDSSIQCTRDVISRLRPVALDMGIVPAIRWLCEEFTRHNGKPCTLLASDDIKVAENLAVSAFRVVQEALTNVAKYAEASKVEISMQQDAENFSVTISDDGKGFDYSKIPNRSFGLLGMRERAISLGGTVNIYSTPQQGTHIYFVVPLNRSSVNEPHGAAV